MGQGQLRVKSNNVRPSGDSAKCAPPASPHFCEQHPCGPLLWSHLVPGQLTLRVTVTGSPKMSDQSWAVGASPGADAAVAGKEHCPFVPLCWEGLQGRHPCLIPGSLPGEGKAEWWRIQIQPHPELLRNLSQYVSLFFA